MWSHGDTFNVVQHVAAESGFSIRNVAPVHTPDEKTPKEWMRLCGGKMARASRPRPHDSLLDQRASVAVRFFFWGDYYGGGYAVAGLQVQEADALG